MRNPLENPTDKDALINSILSDMPKIIEIEDKRTIESILGGTFAIEGDVKEALKKGLIDAPIGELENILHNIKRYNQEKKDMAI